ncbi:GNAT family N-acetyltransferase [Rossellomorea oryzaecorticis]|uniref:GNAT family N-acetyltransferase n=1 Tax=Rossellomorea oryzaecorticis TaxID=1396505 RepID=A0ABU9K6H9_9BACI
MSISIQPPANTEELVRFIEKVNRKKSSHVGYCGGEKEEILDTLLNDFSDLKLEDSFMVAYRDGSIVGAIGFDIDLEEITAEVWGPFVDEGEGWKDLAGSLWERSLVMLGKYEIKSVSFFLNQLNKNSIHFVSLLNGVHQGDHLILKAGKETIPKDGYCSGVSPYTPEHKAAFLTLHKESFPDTYYRGEEILDKLNNENQLLTAHGENGEFTGYVYLEASPQHGEGTIEYIAVSLTHRKKGVGVGLVKAALKRLFEIANINEISLCVSKENTKAINLYTSAGFVTEHELVYYQVQLK